jgi:protein-L-isoaspartate(D-aspartate) O-methyltransferase
MMKKLLLLAFIAVANEAMAQDAQCVPERAAMVEIIRAYARSDASLLGPQGISERVLEAMGQTERHRFIPGRSCSVAYMDGPVLIGQGQTISQPFIVALMTHLAAVKFDHTVLEVGTGSGYQAAVLARLVRKVCTVEIIPPLAEAAAKVLRELGYDNVSVKVGDGYHGWPECGSPKARSALGGSPGVRRLSSLSISSGFGDVSPCLGRTMANDCSSCAMVRAPHGLDSQTNAKHG